MPESMLLTEQPARRGFLRSLVLAPAAALATHRLIIPAGAGVVPASERESLLDAYACWLDNERRWLAWERADGDKAMFDAYLRIIKFEGHRANDYHHGQSPMPSTRAQTVLAAAKCQWRLNGGDQ